MIINSINKTLVFLLVLFTSSLGFAHDPPEKHLEPIGTESYDIDSLAQSIYSDLQSQNLEYTAFYEAFSGYLKYSRNGLIKKTNVITIIDFDKPSNEKRFFVVDIEKKQILFSSYVAHGQNTGGLIAKYFSNSLNSHQSSLGFYLTDKTYQGKHGLSLRLDGLEKGINDNARKRNIVMHSADYVSDRFIYNNNRLGRSWGCPALPKEGYKEVIEQIKNKSLLFIHSSKRQ